LKPSGFSSVAKELLEPVGDVEVVQREGVAVLPQGGAGFGVAESLLGLQELAFADEDGRDGAPEAVQADVTVPVPADEGGEPVAQGAGAQPLLVVRCGAEQPRAERLTGVKLVLPGLRAVLPQPGGAGPKGDPPTDRTSGTSTPSSLIGQSDS